MVAIDVQKWLLKGVDLTEEGGRERERGGEGKERYLPSKLYNYKVHACKLHD